MELTKRIPIRSKAIRSSANGEVCTCCGRNDGTTVFCHLNESWAGKGMGQKADDFGFFGCFIYHTVYDKRGKEFIPNSGRVYAMEDLDILRACYRTWRRLWELGIITIKGEK